ncbi:hypothetical protein QG37_04236 [Candidozyma auris]|nr:hypothetical protein QG37_04236 [[Candida] auris]
MAAWGMPEPMNGGKMSKTAAVPNNAPWRSNQ